LLALDKVCVAKFFEPGDLIRIIHGKYKGETGIVIDSKKQDNMKMKVKREHNNHHPLIKFDRSQREVRVNPNMFKLKTDYDDFLIQDLEMSSLMAPVKYNTGDVV
jgi:transcription antitermination factor NusG